MSKGTHKSIWMNRLVFMLLLAKNINDFGHVARAYQ
jgi:hypothetical protein